MKRLFDDDVIRSIRRRAARGVAIRALAREHKTCPKTIRSIVENRTYVDVPRSRFGLTDTAVLEIRHAFRFGRLPAELAHRHGVSVAAIWNVVRGRTHRSVEARSQASGAVPDPVLTGADVHAVGERGPPPLPHRVAL